MRICLGVLVLLCAVVPQVYGEVLVRWDTDHVPPAEALGVRSLLVPLERTAVIAEAAQKGYRVFVEVDAAQIATARVPAVADGGIVVRGTPTDAQLRRARTALLRPGGRLLTLEERGKWPHVRLNEVTKRNDVLQVASRSAQPWLENNGALVRLAGLATADATTWLAHPWTSLTGAGEDEGPALEHYLVAIAEAGSTGASLVLPLHATLQRALLQGRPDARRDWETIRRYLEFYGWDVPRHYEPIASVGVVTADPLASFEVLNLLVRHNLPFQVLRPTTLTREDVDRLALLVVLDPPAGEPANVVQGFEAQGGTVMRPEVPVVDPNAFALDVRNRLGPERRSVDIWNGITVLVEPRRDPADGTVLLSLVNYAHEERPVQLRVRGTFAAVSYESPEQALMLLPFTHRHGATEFVVPDLRVGGRVFLRSKGRED
jgi:hypothetical protein